MRVGWRSVRVRYGSIPAGEFTPAREIELRVDVVQMVLDCALADSKMVGDLFVAEPLRHHSGDSDFRHRQRGRGRPWRRLFSEQGFDGATQRRLLDPVSTRMYLPDALHEQPRLNVLEQDTGDA